VESIFVDPVFDHKAQVHRLDHKARLKLLDDVEGQMKQIENKLKKPTNYKQFFWSKNMN
jgi:16S rRNA U1498 N3-methylase RsmE